MAVSIWAYMDQAARGQLRFQDEKTVAQRWCRPSTKGLKAQPHGRVKPMYSRIDIARRKRV